MNPELRILMLEDLKSDADLIEFELRRGKLSFSARRVENSGGLYRAIRGIST
jgi:hypothetical protein